MGNTENDLLFYLWAGNVHTPPVSLLLSLEQSLNTQNTEKDLLFYLWAGNVHTPPMSLLLSLEDRNNDE